LIAMARISACGAALFVSSEAIQLLGGYGYMTEYEVERFYRDAKALEIISENSGLLKDTIAENIVGKIR
jgi:alkylation response protein AidB-like acyl-CoA dehydrogenase